MTALRLEGDSLYARARLMRQSEACVLLWELRQSGRGRGSVTIRHWSIAESMDDVLALIHADRRLYARRDAYERFIEQAQRLFEVAAAPG